MGSKDHHRNGALFWQEESAGLYMVAMQETIVFNFMNRQHDWLVARHLQHKAAEAAAKARAHLWALLELGK